MSETDVVVVGTGLAGLVAALRVAEAGLSVRIVAVGVGGTHLGGATIDVLGYGPERLGSALDGIGALRRARPDHPYARLGDDTLRDAMAWFCHRLGSLGYAGRLDRNVLLPTAVGAPKPSSLVPASMRHGDLGAGAPLLIVGFRQLKDFYAPYLADNLRAAALGNGQRLDARSVEVQLQTDGEADVGPVQLARRLEQPRVRRALVDALRRHVHAGDRVGFPAVLGLDAVGEVCADLEQELGARVFEIPTLPPSVPGIRVYRRLREALRRAGVRQILDAPVIGFDGSGGVLESVSTRSASRPLRHSAGSFVLATGGIASGGLELDAHGALRETVFGLPALGLPADGAPPFGRGYLDDHPLARAGVRVDDSLRPLDVDGGPVWTNLYAAGAILAGAVPWREASGNGISVATGYAAAAALTEEDA